jgi:putative 4-mercaptohistidine N1-methyltranferase
MTNPYETDRLLAEYLLFHYGSAEEILPYEFGPAGALDFPARVVHDCLDRALPAGARALDLGCAVGRSSFELAYYCAEVIGVDFSQNFIRAASRLRDHGQLAYLRTDEGHLTTPCTARPPADINRRRVRFEVGDALAMRPGLGTFHVVLMANLIDRLPDPRRCLDQLPALLQPGGQLIIASPFTWMEEYTPPENWLGGFERDGRQVETFASLQTILAAHFDFVTAVDLPFLIREHARKFQWSVSRAGVWRRH